MFWTNQEYYLYCFCWSEMILRTRKNFQNQLKRFWFFMGSIPTIVFWSWNVLRIYTLSCTNHLFVNIFKLLKSPRFYLVDAYPLLCRVITITVAILISSERAFSILKRVKSGLRSSMLQRRLKTLLLIAIEKAIVADLDKSNRTDTYSKKFS